MPVTPVLSPSTSSSVLFHLIVTLPSFSRANSLSARIFSERNLSRRCTTVTWLGDVRQIQRFFDGGVAAADHGHVLALVEEAVTRGTSRHALAGEGLFRRQAEILGRSAGSDDQCVAGVGAGVADQGEGLFGQLGGVNMVEHHFGVEARCMGFKAGHQLRALHAVGVGRPVVHIGGGHQLAALGDAGDDDGVQVGAGGIHGRGVASGAGAEDQQGNVAGGAGAHDGVRGEFSVQL